MRILVTGAAGMLGRDVVHAARAAEHEVVALARADLDVTDAGSVDRVLADHRPGAVINCAAWTDVDGAEEREAAALAVNAAGAGNVARAAAAAGASRRPRLDRLRVRRAQERALRRIRPDRAALRLRAHEAGRRGRGRGRRRPARHRALVVAVRRGRAQLRGHDARAWEPSATRSRVVTDQVGCPTWTGHLAPALVALAQGGAEGVFHVAGAGAASWNTLTIETFQLAGVDCRVQPATTDEFPRPAPRPAYSVLGSERRDAPRLPPWQDGLAAYLAERTRRSRREAARLRRRRVHRLELRAAAPARARRRGRRAGQAHVRRARGESPGPARRPGLLLRPWRHRGPGGRRRERWGTARRSSTSPPRRTSTARSPSPTPSSRPTGAAPTCCSRRRASTVCATSRCQPTRSTARSRKGRSPRTRRWPLPRPTARARRGPTCSSRRTSTRSGWRP